MAGLFVKKGDTVLVISGKDRGVQGRVISAIPDSSRVLVEGVNQIKKHVKAAQSAKGAQEGGIVTQEAAIHVSNVQVVCPTCGKATRIGHRKGAAGEDGKARNVRVCKRCNGDI